VLFATVQSNEPRINKCFVSPSCGLFLTCTGENVFLICIVLEACICICMCGVYKCKNNPLTWECWLFVQGRELLPLLVPCSESTGPFLTPLPGPRCPPPSLLVHTCEHSRLLMTSTCQNFFYLVQVQYPNCITDIVDTSKAP
jgi:hypothetical protein